MIVSIVVEERRLEAEGGDFVVAREGGAVALGGGVNRCLWWLFCRLIQQI